MANNNSSNQNPVITIWGRVGKVKELNYTPSGKTVLNFSVAVNTKKGEEEITTWYEVAAWDKEATHWDGRISKGMPVAVMGPVKTEEYTKSDGSKGTSLKMNAWKLIADDISGREAEDDEDEPASYSGSSYGSSNRTYDEIPF